MRYSSNAIFRYRGWDRRFHKQEKGYVGFVNDHHLIPLQHRNHNLLKKIDYDIHGNFNLLIMPTKTALTKFFLHPDTYFHRNHPKYNKYIKMELDNIERKSKTNDEREYNLWLFVHYVRKSIICRENIPW